MQFSLIRKYGLTLSLVFMSLYAFGQNVSNRGKEFWFSYPDHVNGVQSVMGIYISSDRNTTATLTVGGTSLPAISVPANGVVRRFLGSVPANSDFTNTGVHLGNLADGIGLQKGIKVTSTDSVVVFAHIIYQARSGASLIIPTRAWGREYIVPSFGNFSASGGPNAGFGQVNIMVSRPGTAVKITPVQPFRSSTRPSLTPYTITLDPGDVYQVQFSQNTDISGTKIESLPDPTTGACGPIAVFSATTWSAFPCLGSSGGDNLFQQLFPVSTWGKMYITTPLKKLQTSGSLENVDIIRVFVNDPSTIVSKTENGVTTNLTGLVSSGSFYQYSSSQPTQIVADKPIQVVQYVTSETCGLGSGSTRTPSDPEMIILNPVEQTISNISVFSASQAFVPTGQSQVSRHYINAVIKTSNIPTFTINGSAPASTFITIPGTDYSFVKEDVTNRVISNANPLNPISTLSSSAGFSAIAYGFGSVESYGYNAGTNLNNLSQFISSSVGGINTQTACVGTPVNFCVSFSYKPTEIKWDFPASIGVSDITISNPVPTDSSLINQKWIYKYCLSDSYELSNPNLYTISVLATIPGSSGCAKEQVDYDLNLLPRPLANFTTNSLCANSPTQFTDNSSLSGQQILSWSWNFGNGNVSDIPSPIQAFSASGTYTVTYSIVTVNGCKSDTLVTPIFISNPSGQIIGTTSVCQNSTPPFLTLIGSDGLAPYTFFYNGPGGALSATTSAGSNSVTITVPTNNLGTFQYSLISISDGNSPACSQNQSGTVSVTVFPNPNGNISGGVSVCLNSPQPQITFTGTDGTAPYTFSYNINNGSTFTITSSSSGIATILVPTTTAGTYSYTLTNIADINGPLCSKNVFETTVVSVNSLPTATISGSTSVCLNAPEPLITFTGAGTSAPYTFFYSINGGSTLSVTTTGGNTATVSVPTTTAGTYTYTLLSVTDGTATTCSQPQTGSAAVTVWPLPQSAYTTSSPVCQAGTISFTDQSIANVGTVTGWSWNFGDPSSGGQNTSTLQNPIHHFATAGTYTITLTVTTSNGCVSVNAISPLLVHPKPRAGYIIPEVCLSDTYAQYTDTSSVASPSTITAWLWNFGNPNATPPANPNTSTLQNPQHSYTAVGNYNVSLIVTSNQGCKDTINQQLTVNGSFPVASFAVNSPSTLCANDSVRITNNSTVLPGVITKVEIWWDNIGAPATVFVDDNPVFGRVYSYQYPNFQSPLTKTYQIKFRAYSGGVCMRDVTQNITVNAAPKVQFNAIPNICFDAPLYQITQASEIGNVPGSGVFSGTGVTSSGVFNPASVGAGTYSISYLYTSTAGGCKDSLTRTIKVWERAIADFTVTTQPFCERQPITFTSTSTSTEGTLTSYVWNFANGAGVFTTTSAAALTRTYATYGTYNVKLNVVTSNNCVSADKIIPVEVKPLARPNFSFPAISCLPNANVQFTNLSTVPNAASSTLTYLWDFGDPPSGTVNNSTAVDPSHVYVNLGPYNVKLTATTGDGCIHDTTIVLNTIHPQPIASFITDAIDVCIGAPFLFTSTSNPADGTIQSYSWDMADGATRTLGSFSYTYADTGTYVVSHFIVNSFGCKSTIATKTVYVNGYPDADAGPDKQMLEGGQVQLTPPNNYPMPVTFAWTPPTYLDDPTRIDPTARPPDDITYLLTVSSNKGCSDTSSVFIKVLKDPPVPNIFSPNGDGIHDTWIIPYLDSYPGCTVEVVNRYGNLVFRSVGYATPWDGKVKGKDVPVGTYYFVIDPKNGRKKKAGYVDIIR